MKLTKTPNEMCESNERGDILLKASRGCFWRETTPGDKTASKSTKPPFVGSTVGLAINPLVYGRLDPKTLARGN